MSVNRVVSLAAFFLFLFASTHSASAIFERDLPVLTASGEKTQGVVEVENDRDSPYKSYDVKLVITAKGLEPRGVYTVWLVERKDGGATRGLGVSPYSFTSDGAGTGRFIDTMPNYEFARWEMIEIRYHPDGNAKDMANSVVVQKVELWRAHPY